MAPGILYVTMQPAAALDKAAFQDWYNNEHGPLRLRLSPQITNGFRYRALDLDNNASADSWMAIYDLPDISFLDAEGYLKLRSPPIQSSREQSLRPDVTINRRNFDEVRTWTSSSFSPLETLASSNKEDNILVATTCTVLSESSLSEFNSWFEDEHVSMISKIPGWLRSRRFIVSPTAGQTKHDYLALHEYTSAASLQSAEMVAVKDDPRTKEMMKHVGNTERRVWKRYYTFGPAPRDLAPLRHEATSLYDSPSSFARCKTFPSHTSTSRRPALESYVTTSDGAILPYRLEGGGSSDETGPVIVLVNSILTTWGIWDSFVAKFFENPQNQHYRVLRYNSRGRYSPCGAESTSITVDTLASDLVALLDALRIPAAAAAVGVSLGGATVLAAALKHSARIERFMACDTSAASPAGNAKAWGERIEMSEREGATRRTAQTTAEETSESIAVGMDGLLPEGEAIVGEELAEATTRRWFVPASYEDTAQAKECERVKKMVTRNSLQGFKRGVRALWEYDYKPLLEEYKGKGYFLVGGSDGALPKSMKEMASSLGANGTELITVEGAGHLPMVEKPQEVVAAVERLLVL